MAKTVKPSKAKSIGILTSGGDCPGLNAAIRGVAKAARGAWGMDVFGFLDGFNGLVENRFIALTDRELSGLLTIGGTILGTSRNKPHKMPQADGTTRDMTSECVENYKKLGLDCLVCIGGGGTAKNALELKKAGLNVVNLPKTIDNDVAETDITFGFDTAMLIATEAIDRLHTTASSHQRIIQVNLMGHNAGWLALGASLAGGADVCLIPEIPYDINKIIEALMRRRDAGRRFSIVAVAEGALPIGFDPDLVKKLEKEAKKKRTEKEREEVMAKLPPHFRLPSHLCQDLEQAVKMEMRSTTLGYIQRGGIPSPTDRLLATQLGVAAAELIARGEYGVMVAVKNGHMVPVPLEKVAGSKKMIPLDHEMIRHARLMGLCLGD